jgi:ElaB/YqjD/DUF883 family membrane-anchored ribosome-binding protein
MTEEGTGNSEKQNWDASNDAWKQVGEQFATLGESIAGAFKGAWNSESNQQVAGSVRDGLKSLAHSVAQAIDDAAASPEGQKFREDAEQFVSSAHDAGKQAVQDARPHILSALEQVNQSLKDLISQLGGTSDTEEDA